MTELFKNLETFISNNKFEPTRLPWRMENDSYSLIQSQDKDSYGYAIYTIESKRHDDVVFRGRLKDSIVADLVFWCVKDDYLLNP